MRHHQNPNGSPCLVRIRGRLALLVALLAAAGTLRAGPVAAATHQDQVERAASLGAFSSEVLVAGRDGAATLTQPLRLPAARGRWQPSLTLTYSSRAAGGPEGVGWTLGGSWIERTTRGSPDDQSAQLGQPRLQYWLVRDGTSTRLVALQGQGPDGTVRYRPEVQIGFTEVRLHSGTIAADPWWELVDGLGTRLSFTLPSAPRVGQFRCAAWLACTRWYLTEAHDVDGNDTVYDYAVEPALVSDRSSPSLLLGRIRYNRFAGSPTGAPVYATEVDLDYEPDTHPTVEAVAGTLVRHERRLADVRVLQRGTPEQTMTQIGGWQLGYEQSPDTGRNRLVELRALGNDGTLAPRPTQFTYQANQQGMGLNDSEPMTPPPGPAEEVHPAGDRCDLWLDVRHLEPVDDPPPWCSVEELAAWVDLDGDRRPDLVWGGGTDASSARPLGLRWAQNISAPGGALAFADVRVLTECADPACQQQQKTSSPAIVSAHHPTGEKTGVIGADAQHTNAWTLVRQRLFDLNSDGRPDLLSAAGGACAPKMSARFAIGDAQGLHFGPEVQVDVQPVGGARDQPGSLCHVMRGNQDPAASFGLSVTKGRWLPRGRVGGSGDTLADLTDVTGDGLPDFIVADPDLQAAGQPSAWNVFPLYQTDHGAWRVATPQQIPVASLPIRRIDPDGSTTIDLLDLNGDGLADRMQTGPGAADGSRNWTVEYGDGSAFAPSHPWSVGDPAVQAIAQSRRSGDLYTENTTLLSGVLADLNGDGRADYVHKPTLSPQDCPPPPCPVVGRCPPPVAVCPFIVSVNSGTGFDAAKLELPMPHRPRPTGGDREPTLEQADLYPYGVHSPQGAAENGTLIDVDGDGILDYVNTVNPRTSGTDTTPGAWLLYRGNTASGLSRTDLLTQTTSPLGARTDLTYAPSTRFTTSDQPVEHGNGAVTPVLIRNSLCGPALNPPCPPGGAPPQGGGTHYWYAHLVVTTSLADPAQPELRGFADTWTQDPSGTVVHTTHVTDRHAFAGQPLLIERGTAIDSGSVTSPPDLHPFETTTVRWAAHPIGKSGCIDAPGDDPVIPVATAIDYTTIQDGVPFTSRVTVDCATVDDNGTIGTRTIDPDTALPSDERIETVRYDRDAACTACPVETETTEPATPGRSAPLLAHAFYRYHAPTGTSDQPLARGKAGSGHLAYVERQAAAGSDHYEIAERLAYNHDGTLALREQTDPAVSTHYRYDSTGLHATAVIISDQHARLETDRQFDPATGNLTLLDGPFVPGDTTPHSRHAYAYDAFGRLIATAKAPVMGNSVQQATSAVEYLDTATPPAIRTWQFATPVTLTTGRPPRDTPAAQLTITYLDALGRQIQQRARLGSLPSADIDHEAHLVDHLDPSAYRVSGAQLYDSSGHVQAMLDPFDATGDGYVDYWRQANPDGDRFARPLVTSTTYDAQGRPVCTAEEPVNWQRLVDDRPCMSELTDGPGYRRATAISYGTATLHQRTYRTVRIVPSRENSAPNGRAMTRYLDAAGRLAASQDAYGNVLELERDPLARVIAIVRQSTGGAAGVTVSSTTAYDLLGRITSQHDPSFGRRVYGYLPGGQLAHIGMAPTLDRPDGTSSVDYDYGSLGRRTRTLHNTWHRDAENWHKQTVVTSILDYDTPNLQSGRSASGPYQYTAGQVTQAWSPATTIAFGYDADGNISRRDQWFGTAPARHTVTRAFGNDDRLLTTTVHLPELGQPVTYDTEYDSAGQPVRLDHEGQVWWAAINQSGTGAYDTLGRVRRVQEDNGKAAETATYSPFTQQLAAQTVTLPTGPIYQVTNLRYAADKLVGATDPVAGDSTTMAYDHDGRLTRWQLDGGNPQRSVTKQFTAALDKTTDADGSEFPSIGNLEREVTRTAAGTTDQIYRYDKDSHDQAIEVDPGPTGQPERYSYDSRGLLTGHDPGGERYAYDAEARLVRIATPTQAETLAYDAFGNLAERTIRRRHNGREQVTTVLRFVGDDGTISRQGAGVATGAAHVLLGDVRVASVRADSTLYLHHDRIGSVVATSLDGGRAGARYAYGPYGEQLSTANSSALTESDLRFQNAELLTNGVLHLQARQYDPKLRRFLQPDNVDIERYTFVRGDPVNRVDPSGHRDIVVGWRYQGYSCSNNVFCTTEYWSWPDAPASTRSDACGSSCESAPAATRSSGADVWDKSTFFAAEGSVASDASYNVGQTSKEPTDNTPVVDLDPQTVPKLGSGWGLLLSGSAEAGSFFFGGSAQVAFGAAVLQTRQGPVLLLFASGGRFLGGPQPPPGGIVGGLSLGGGVGPLWTNAHSKQDFDSMGQSLSVNTPVVSGQWSSSPGGHVDMVAGTVGPTKGGSFSIYSGIGTLSTVIPIRVGPSSRAGRETVGHYF
jgi:RHS repeat-associated protein